MSYTPQNFQPYEVLTAAKLNAMDSQIALNEQKADSAQADASSGLTDIGKLKGDIAPAYSNSSTYAVGDYCIYNGILYRCKTAISTAEAWNSAHWETAVVGDELTDLKSALNSIGLDVENGVMVISPVTSI